MLKMTCFKAYDVRGQLGVNFDADICYKISRAFAIITKAKLVIIGRDARESSPELSVALMEGLIDEGVSVLDIGMCGTEEVYHATDYFNADGGIEVTASHNPIDYNGLKMVGLGARPLHPIEEFREIKKIAETRMFDHKKSGGSYKLIQEQARIAFIDKVMTFVNLKSLRNLSIVVNCGNGAVGPTFDALAKKLVQKEVNFNFSYLYKKPDSSFPNGIPNPLLVENQAATSFAVVKNKADFGIAFDGDFDRCFFFDEKGNFIEGQYIVSLLATMFLEINSNAIIVHDPRMIWNIKEVVKKMGGEVVQSKVGHSFIKDKMRKYEAVYGGEMSAHHYFRDFSYCDSGIIPWLLIAQLLCQKNVPLSSLVDNQIQKYPSSGEINFKVVDAKKILDIVIESYEKGALKRDEMDGVSLEFDEWRFNLRASNTEPMLRLNIESKGKEDLVDNKRMEISQQIKIINDRLC